MNFKRPLKVVRYVADEGTSWSVHDSKDRPTGLVSRRKSRADEAAKAINVYPASERLAHAAGRIVSFLVMVEATVAMDGEQLADDTVVVSIMGHGASDAIRVKDLRELQAALVDYAQHVMPEEAV